MAAGTKFEIGETVKLKSGGPVMTVMSVPGGGYGGDTYGCQWFAGKKLESGHFPGDSLESAAVADK